LLVIVVNPTGKFLDPGMEDQLMEDQLMEELPEKSDGEASSIGKMPGSAITQHCNHPTIDDQDCDDWLGENDCDDTDDSLGPWRTFYADNDGDGHSTSIPSQICTAIVQTGTPSGYMLTAGGDCDDNNQNVGLCPIGTMFTTNTIYQGNLGGLSGADLKCTSSASSTGLPGTWTAFLSSSIVDVKDRIQTIPSDQPMHNLRGDVIVNSKNDLFYDPARGNIPGQIEQILENSIRRNEQGNILPVVQISDYFVFTGSHMSGSGVFQGSVQENCNDWTSCGGYAVGGAYSKTNRGYMMGSMFPCCGNLPIYHGSRLYCVRTS
jgi:hypothetical protein